MRFFFSAVRVAVAAIALCGSIGFVAAPSAAADPNSLYARLGGYDAIAAVTDDFIGRLATDPQLSKFFGGVSQNSQDRIRQLVVDQLCAATGGPCKYIGRDMKTAHRGMHITEADWNKAVADLKMTLDAFKVGAKEQGELVGALATLKNDIVDSK
jgi:hemoglobin